MSRGTNVFGSSCANRTKYSTPPAYSNAIWIASRMDWFILFGVPFARSSAFPWVAWAGLLGRKKWGDRGQCSYSSIFSARNAEDSAPYRNFRTRK